MTSFVCVYELSVIYSIYWSYGLLLFGMSARKAGVQENGYEPRLAGKEDHKRSISADSVDLVSGPMMMF